MKVFPVGRLYIDWPKPIFKALTSDIYLILQVQEKAKDFNWRFETLCVCGKVKFNGWMPVFATDDLASNEGLNFFTLSKAWHVLSLNFDYPMDYN